MQLVRFVCGRSLILSGLAVCALLTTVGCHKNADANTLGTFHMGERVQIGSLVYTILEAQWRPALTEAGTGPAPKNRYLLVKLSVTNGGGSQVPAPPFTIEDDKGKSYSEVTQGVDEVVDYFGVLRTIAPAQTEQGFVVFDAPLGAYKLLISDGGEPGSERYARVTLPVSLE